MATALLAPDKLAFYDLEKLHQFYQNAYGHFKPAGQNGLAPSLESIVPPAKLSRIRAVSEAYQNHPLRFVQAKLF